MIGLGVGTAIGLAISKPLESYVYGISRWDAWTMVLAAVISALLALIAAAGPARRAMRLDLVAALRSE